MEALYSIDRSLKEILQIVKNIEAECSDTNKKIDSLPEEVVEYGKKDVRDSIKNISSCSAGGGVSNVFKGPLGKPIRIMVEHLRKKK
ncbi:MAG: hypothetical protein AB2558_21460 [Candidatus Thiodiazotropha sp.]